VPAGAPRRSWLDPEQVQPLLDAVVGGQRGGKVTPDRRTRAALAQRSAPDCASAS
jgi:hypothetical protein